MWINLITSFTLAQSDPNQLVQELLKSGKDHELLEMLEKALKESDPADLGEDAKYTRRDSNPQPSVPKTDALSSWATDALCQILVRIARLSTGSFHFKCPFPPIFYSLKTVLLASFTHPDTNSLPTCGLPAIRGGSLTVLEERFCLVSDFSVRSVLNLVLQRLPVPMWIIGQNLAPCVCKSSDGPEANHCNSISDLQRRLDTWV